MEMDSLPSSCSPIVQNESNQGNEISEAADGPSNHNTFEEKTVSEIVAFLKQNNIPVEFCEKFRG